MTRVKICGLVTLEDALAACDAGADALGFNFAPEARARGRYIDPADAREIVRKLPPFVTTVAVCVNPSAAHVAEWLKFLDCVQLHGSESVPFAAAFREKAIKAFRVSEGFEPESMLDYTTPAYLLDASVPGYSGGSGQAFDWTIAQKAVALGTPIILAGGLTPDNVAEAIQTVRPAAVDTASGVESAPGKKDHERIRDFVRNAKNALSG